MSVASLLLELSLLHMLLVASVAAPFAVSAAYISASIFQFCVLRYVIFRVTHRPVLMQVNAYIASAILSWLAVLGTVTALTYFLHLSTMLAREITIPLLFPVNYVLSRYFIFRR